MKTTDEPDQAAGTPRRQFLKIAGGAAVAVAAAGRPAAAGSAWFQGNGRERPISIDLHTHWEPQVYAKALAAETGQSAGASNPLSYDLDKRRQWMDEHGVQIHVLTLSGMMPWQRVSPEAGVRLARIINDAAVEAHAAYPDRYLAGIELPIRDPQASLQELNRMAGKPGLRVVHLPNSYDGFDYLFEPGYGPLLARCEELGYPLVFHPLDGDANIYAGAQRLGGPWEASNLNNTLGFPFEHATTAAKFIVSGTLDKYPKLQVVLSHSGGAFPYIAGRIERGLSSKNFRLPHPFREYIRRFHYDSIAFYPETMRYLIALVGSDRIVIGTDNYAAMDTEPNALVESLNLPAADRERILRGNAARLLGL